MSSFCANTMYVLKLEVCVHLQLCRDVVLGHTCTVIRSILLQFWMFSSWKVFSFFFPIVSITLVWQSFGTGKTPLDLCTAGFQVVRLYSLFLQSARGLPAILETLDCSSIIITTWQILCMHFVLSVCLFVCIEMMGCALVSRRREIIIKIPGEKKIPRERTSLKFLLFMPSVLRGWHSVTVPA